MALLYSATLFLSAFLLFAIQPMAGKRLLPWLGGSPDVWNTCMFFFQAVLLLGYLYAHGLDRFVSRRAQPLVHLLMLALATLLVLNMHPHAPGAAAEVSGHPIAWVLLSLGTWVGVPYFALASTSPLLQRWFGDSSDPRAADPYFLYSASNWGSFCALLSYPLVVEPWLGLEAQRKAWVAGFVVLVAALTAVALKARAASHGRGSKLAASARGQRVASRRVRPRERATWIVLAFLPSSLLLGTTTYLSTDIAPIPMLWVVPLAIYLVTFIYAIRVGSSLFARLEHAVALLALLLILTLLMPSSYPAWLVVALNLLMLSAGALLCHAELMRRRPPVGDLTGFYLCVSVGGVLGGLFNSIAAPLLFRSAVEYPLVILALCAARHVLSKEKRSRPRADVAFAVGVGALSVALGQLATLVPKLPTFVHNLLVSGVPLLLCLSSIDKARRFALTLAIIWACTVVFPAGTRSELHASRNFFGAIQVLRDRASNTISLYHGRTLHGIQSEAPGMRTEPMSYYARSGPVGEVFMYLKHPARVGVIGLGAGTLLAYAKPGDRWTCFELNPSVVEVARNPQWFTYLRDARASRVSIELGDARLKIAEAKPRSYDVLVLDAFGSDSIPIHLLTREALALYFRALDAHGLLLAHISNNYLDLTRALGPLAADAGATAFVRDDAAMRETDLSRLASTWVALSLDPKRLEVMARDPRWQKLGGSAKLAWSDDYFNLLSLLRIR